jgi:inner membrane protein
MDPVTHAVIGLSLAKLTGNSLSLGDAATVAITVGAVLPDIDIVMQKWGDYVYLKNHRGVTHSVLGLVVSAVILGAMVKAIFPESGFLSLTLWSLLGCFSHSFFDVFNSYGAKLLWPLSGKKLSLSLLIIFDPIFISALLGYVITSGTTANLFLIGFAAYLAVRVLMRLGIRLRLEKLFGSRTQAISILPSMTGLLRWHFILDEKECNTVGEMNILKRGVRIVQKLQKLPDEGLDQVRHSSVGCFFAEFTPLFHIACEKVEGLRRYIFIDMRYTLRGKFLHHAVVEFDENNTVVRSSFNPYSINRSVEI